MFFLNLEVHGIELAAVLVHLLEDEYGNFFDHGDDPPKGMASGLGVATNRSLECGAVSFGHDLLQVFQFDAVLVAELVLKSLKQSCVFGLFIEELFTKIKHFGIDWIVAKDLPPCDVFEFVGDDFHFGNGGVDDEAKKLRQDHALLSIGSWKSNRIVINGKKVSICIDWELPIKIQFKIERLVLLQLKLTSQSFVIEWIGKDDNPLFSLLPIILNGRLRERLK